MNISNKTAISLFIIYLLSMNCSFSEKYVPAFPGAEGGAKFASGGRGGSVYYVTSLEDSDAIQGTLRWCLSQKSPSTILFKVAGIIDLKSELKVKKDNITIAGQSAPGDGICIKGYPFYISADNIIIRYIRFRMGNENNVQDDALKANKHKNIIIDHCSMSWSTDECASFYDNENFTMQWCIISESLRNSVHKKGSHGYGGIWGGQNASFHHNLLAHHDSRNPRFCGSRYTNRPDLEKVDFKNNVIYNWGSNSAYAAEGGSYNIVNNFYKPGPATLSKKGKLTYRILSPNSDDGSNEQVKGVWGKFFIKGNIMDNNKEVTKDNIKGFHLNLEQGEKTTVEILSAKPFVISNIKIQSAKKAYKLVLKNAGASLVRDTIDRRIINEVKNGIFTFHGSNGSQFGIIDSQNDVGGWPEYTFNASKVPVDSDNDGMPDFWEIRNKLNLNDPTDGGKFTISKTYTNLEVYLESILSNY